MVTKGPYSTLLAPGRRSWWHRLRWLLSRTKGCGCMCCDPPWRVGFYRMYVCEACGSKRCAGAVNHRRQTCAKARP